jgi:hypothetical protein
MSRAVTIVLCLGAFACKREAANALPAPADNAPMTAPRATPPANAPTDDTSSPTAHPGMNMPAGHPAMSGDSMAPDPSASGTMPGKVAPTTPDKLADGRLAIGPFAVAVPADWTVKPVTSSMRAADFVVPPDSELIVYYFGASGAGSVDDNLDRWFGQFTQADGKSSRDAAKIEKVQFAGQDATYVAVGGHYTAMAMPGATDAVDKADQAMLATIIGSPTGPYYFKLVGSKKTVDAIAPKFRAMFTSLKLR